MTTKLFLQAEEPAFTVTNLAFLRVNRRKGYQNSNRNGRNYNGLIYARKGRLSFRFSDPNHSFDLEQGQLAFLPQNAIYTAFYQEEENEIDILDFALSSGTLPHYLQNPTLIHIHDAGERMQEFFKPSRYPSLDRPWYYRARIYDFFFDIERGMESLPEKYRKLSPALEILERSETMPSVPELAQECHMSEVHFRRLMREYTGNSPVEYRHHLRLTQARRLLQSGEYNVNEAARETGFSNLSFFIRLYKRKFGQTPKKDEK